MKQIIKIFIIVIIIILTSGLIGCISKEVKESTINYNEGINHMKLQQYDNAIVSFNKVIQDDKKNYSNAQNKLIECKQFMIKKYSNIVKDLFKKKRYDEIDSQVANITNYVNKIPQDILNIQKQANGILAKQRELARIKAEKDKEEAIAKAKKQAEKDRIEALIQSIPTEEEMYSHLHEMINTKIIAADDCIHGLIPITDGECDDLIIQIKASHYPDKKLLKAMVTRWSKHDFRNGVEDHNYLWEKLHGQIGRAIALR